MNTNMNRRRFSATLVSAAAASALAASGSAFAQAGPVEGKDFTRIEPPQPPGVPAGKVEVLEFFSYACPHCSSFEPTIEAWEKQLPAGDERGCGGGRQESGGEAATVHVRVHGEGNG